MLTLPKRMIQVVRQFEAVLSERVWEWAKVLLRGAILAPGERTVAAILRVMGCSDDTQRQNAITDWTWQMLLQVSRWMLARRLVVVADGTYAVLEFLRKVSRLPLVSAITRLRLDACLYDPAPAREAGKRGRHALKGKAQPKLAQRLNDPATPWQKQTLSWYGGTTREMEIATGTALWYQSPVPPVAIRWVLIRGPARPYDPLALLCTDQDAEALQIVEWFVLRWTVEVTFHEVRAHLGVETQRQWSDVAIVRTTPALLALFSLVTIFAQQLLGEHPFPIRQAAWYSKAFPTFSYTLAFVRQHLWPSAFFSVSSREAHTVQIPRPLFTPLLPPPTFPPSS